MPNFEKFGSFLLLEEVGADCIGRTYRAAKLGPAGLDRFVYLTKISPALAQNTALMKMLVEELKASAGLTSPNIAKVYGCGKLEGAYFISWEFVEGKDLGIVFTRMGEGFPLALDQSLYIVSRITSALETAHSAKIEDRSIIHGALSPVDVMLTYEGDVKIKHFNIASVLSKSQNDRKEAYKKIETYLSPEFLDGKIPDKRSDIYALGLVFFRLLTGEPLFTGTRDIDIRQRLDASRMMTPYQDDDRLPQSVSEIILKCVNPVPAGRYPNIKDAKQALDALLVAGDFSPSTFNLAFFMHTAFRSEIETEQKTMQDEKAMNFLQYVEVPPPAPVAPTHPAKAEPTSAGPAEAGATVVVPRPQPVHAKPAPVATPTFMQEAPRKGLPVPLLAGVGVIVVAGAIGGYFVLKPKPGAQTQPSVAQVSPQEAQRLKELEDAKRKTEEQLQESLAAIDALKQQLAEGDKKDQERIKRDIQAREAQALKAKEELKVKEQAMQEVRAPQVPADASSAAVDTPKSSTNPSASGQPAGPAETTAQLQTPPGTSPPPSSPSTTSAGSPSVSAPIAPPSSSPVIPSPAESLVKEGQLIRLDLADSKPVVSKKGTPTFPAIAQKVGASGTVVVSVLIAPDGSVEDAKVKLSSGTKFGFDEAAISAAKKYKFTPAMKDGKRVRVWYDLPKFDFRPPH
ncbi:MAG: TonB family protein [Acidobacteria bacterium]|nr:TonB family protein [Acidobacteriota bacterium]